MNTDFPSEEEQALVRKYVMERPLTRPAITYSKAARQIILSIIVSVGLSFLLYKGFSLLGFFLDKKLYLILFYAVVLVAFSKKFLILGVQLYQHYAPEEVRRRCLLKPTCSEYAIIVIKK